MTHKVSKILFIGYDRTQTNLIAEIENLGYSVDHSSEKITNFSEWDCVISFGYRHLIEPHEMDTAKRPIINLHIAYLPYNRGAHPNFWALFENTPSGVTIHEIDGGVDTGPIIAQRYINFKKEESTFALTYSRLMKELESLFMEMVPSIISGNYSARKQRGKGSYHAAKDLPKEMKTWDVDIMLTIEKLDASVSSKVKNDLAIIDAIEQARRGNNVNWMDLLRIGVRHAPKETKSILSKINNTDNEISNFFSQLCEDETLY
ncbi:formyltransferase family protein [Candidiatus Paracoxiella cheracis]|uniref:formyltransferase family protein n=1 Tax=Candidiatus Paracoxiella cheracis TaxID=3405120 RepID=UPI003BF4A16D